MQARFKIRGPQVRPNNLLEYLDNYRGAVDFLLDAQNNPDDCATFYQLYAEALQHARRNFRRGHLACEFIRDRERDVLAEIGVQPMTLIQGTRVYVMYCAGLIHGALTKMSMEEQ
ncbi:MAG: hypothetical protein GY841_10285 [FCB group bacterium]|nr:hypothetical protein [FCB group bacterium]